jgi:hypothetical protein
MTVDAELMLIQWGAWVRSRGSGLGYPKESPISRVMREGAGASHATTKGEPYMSPSIEVVERCVLSMRENRNHLRRVCMHHFVGGESSRIIAHKLKTDEETINARIKAAIEYLDAFLVAS